MSGLLFRVIGRWAAAGLLLLGWAGAAQAAGYEPPAGKVDFRITHSKYNEIGTHSLAFSRKGEDLVVDVTVKIKVKLLFITAHSVEAARQETWRGGRMTAYSSYTDENGDVFEVSASAQGGKLVIEGPEGKASAEGPVFPTNPWHPDSATATTMMDTKTGKLLKVSVAPAGEEELQIAGKAVKAKKHRVTGELERDLWYDAAGNLLQFSFVRDGSTLTFTRVTPLD